MGRRTADHHLLDTSIPELLTKFSTDRVACDTVRLQAKHTARCFTQKLSINHPAAAAAVEVATVKQGPQAAVLQLPLPSILGKAWGSCCSCTAWSTSPPAGLGLNT